MKPISDLLLIEGINKIAENACGVWCCYNEKWGKTNLNPKLCIKEGILII